MNMIRVKDSETYLTDVEFSKIYWGSYGGKSSNNILNSVLMEFEMFS